MVEFAATLAFPYAPLSGQQLAAAEREVGFPFPAAYRALLQTSNGGIVMTARKHFEVLFADSADARMSPPAKLAPASAAGPAAPRGADDDSGHTIWDNLFELFGIGVPRLIPGPTPQPASLLDENDAFRLEQFLPHDVIGIGRAESESLICLSLAGGDAGAVYYWYYYWHYPWAKAFFDRRVAAVEAAFPNHDAIMRGPRGDDYQALMDAVNYAMMVKLADSLEDFLAQMTDAAPP